MLIEKKMINKETYLDQMYGEDKENKIIFKKLSDN